MADAKVTALSALTAVTGDDLLYVVDDPGGTPASKKATAAVLRDYTGMAHVAITDAAVTMAVNTLYVGSIAGFTADRTYTLPTTAAVGDRIGIMLTVGDDAYELLITAATSDTLNGVAGGTEWSRLFITGEVVIMRCVTADSAWVVEYDGRILQKARMSLGTDITTSSTGYTKTNMDTADYAVGCVIDVATNDTITWRRANYAFIAVQYQPKAAATCADNELLGASASYGGVPGVGTTLYVANRNHPGTAAGATFGSGTSFVSIPAGSAIQHNFYTATTGNLGARGVAGGTQTWISVLEIL